MKEKNFYDYVNYATEEINKKLKIESNILSLECKKIITNKCRNI